MAPFKYRALESTGRDCASVFFTRLLTILPAETDAVLRLEIHHANLVAEVRPKYEALSYVWGSAEDLVPISISYSDDVFGGTLDVTRNLSTALRYLRLADQPRTMWIDAVCIDQSRVDELNSQVTRMAEIYSLAERTVSWLGPEGEDSDFAMRLLRFLAPQLMFEENTLGAIPASDSWANKYADEDWEDREFWAFHHIFYRSYFDRLWVRQEIQHSSPASIVQCGRETVLSIDFFGTIRFLYNKPGSIRLIGGSGSTDFSKRMALILRTSYVYSRLDWLLAVTREAQCAKPQDRIFALHSLATPAERAAIRINYDASVLDVYCQASLASMKGTPMNSLSTITQCDIAQLRPGWPSWIPDWMQPLESRSISYTFADGDLDSQAVYLGHNVLRVAGVFVSTISSIDAIRLPNPITSEYYEETLEELSRLIPREFADVTYMQTRELLGTVVLTSLRCDSIVGESYDYHPPEDFDDLLQHLCDEDWRANNRGPTVVLEDYFEWNDIEYCRGRSLCRTVDGHLGLAPSSSRVGDRICVILGCQTPIVLRPVAGDTHQTQFQVVGQCYIHGLMYGEVIFGEIPPDWRKWKISYDNGQRSHNWIRKTSEEGTTLEYAADDPRLASFKEQFKDLANTDEEGWWKRMPLDVLRKGGIDIHTLDLV